MDSRESVLLGLNHQQPDRVPFDMGGTVVTGINVKPYHGVRRCLGLPGQEPVMMDGRQQIAMVAMGCQICGLRRQN